MITGNQQNAQQGYEKRDRIVVQAIGISYDPNNMPPRFVELQKEMITPEVFEPYFIVFEGKKIPLGIKAITSGASLKGGGFGTCYTIDIRGREFKLFHVQNTWFIEGVLRIG